eukprot:CAMPEP_0179148516 /NCGR_PEP_ID=MMETSP0796-20121207/71877_1 /TAXON_ID=73915 /ORGANISM="Pyrodinium bahamense, Strain pbaha01" /LENGTH=50 /DNA_ID=CAMNT_0020849243 /DNA_START=21 /DNA_END=169 /DNA_ORIENTATION=+
MRLLSLNAFLKKQLKEARGLMCAARLKAPRAGHRRAATSSDGQVEDFVAG